MYNLEKVGIFKILHYLIHEYNIFVIALFKIFYFHDDFLFGFYDIVLFNIQIFEDFVCYIFVTDF